MVIVWVRSLMQRNNVLRTGSILVGEIRWWKACTNNFFTQSQRRWGTWRARSWNVLGINSANINNELYFNPTWKDWDLKITSPKKIQRLQSNLNSHFMLPNPGRNWKVLVPSLDHLRFDTGFPELYCRAVFIALCFRWRLRDLPFQANCRNPKIEKWQHPFADLARRVSVQGTWSRMYNCIMLFANLAMFLAHRIHDSFQPISEE